MGKKIIDFVTHRNASRGKKSKAGGNKIKSRSTIYTPENNPYQCLTSLLQLIISNQVSVTNDHVRFLDDLHLYIVYLNSLTTPLLSQSHYIANYSYPKRMLVCPFISNKQTGFLSARLDIERWLTTETYDCMISKVLRPSEKPLIRSLHLLVSVCMSIYVSLCE